MPLIQPAQLHFAPSAQLVELMLLALLLLPSRLRLDIKHWCLVKTALALGLQTRRLHQ